MWYEAVPAEAPLTQGDIALKCPLVGWASDRPIPEGALNEATLTAPIEAREVDVIILTQSCDLEQNKVDNVILCPFGDLPAYKELWREAEAGRGQNPTAGNWERHCNNIQAGYLWNLAMLNRGEVDELATERLIVDFGDIYTAPKLFLESFLRQRGSHRLRLRPPYREHLAQSFARFFMRVGLPTPIDRNWG